MKAHSSLPHDAPNGQTFNPDIQRNFIAFINYAWFRHNCEHRRAKYELCENRTCRRARQIEIYLILTGQWVEAAYSWLTQGD